MARRNVHLMGPTVSGGDKNLARWVDHACKVVIVLTEAANSRVGVRGIVIRKHLIVVGDEDKTSVGIVIGDVTEALIVG